jgi:hypothetical protein
MRHVASSVTPSEEHSLPAEGMLAQLINVLIRDGNECFCLLHVLRKGQVYDGHEVIAVPEADNVAQMLEESIKTI